MYIVYIQPLGKYKQMKNDARQHLYWRLLTLNYWFPAPGLKSNVVEVRVKAFILAQLLLWTNLFDQM